MGKKGRSATGARLNTRRYVRGGLSLPDSTHPRSASRRAASQRPPREGQPFSRKCARNFACWQNLSHRRRTFRHRPARRGAVRPTRHAPRPGARRTPREPIARRHLGPDPLWRVPPRRSVGRLLLMGTRDPFRAGGPRPRAPAAPRHVAGVNGCAPQGSARYGGGLGFGAAARGVRRLRWRACGGRSCFFDAVGTRPLRASLRCRETRLRIGGGAYRSNVLRFLPCAENFLDRGWKDESQLPGSPTQSSRI